MPHEARGKRERGDSCSDQVSCSRDVKYPRTTLPAAEITPERRAKRKREDSCADTASDHYPKRSKATTANTPISSDTESDCDAGDSDSEYSRISDTKSPAEQGYIPSIASHTHLPFSDPYWPEERAVTLPSPSRSDKDSPETVLWVCGREIPSLDGVWSAHWPLDYTSRRKKQGRLIADAKEAFRVRLKREEYVRSAAFQAIVSKEMEANRLRRMKLSRLFVVPVKMGKVNDEATMRRRLTLYKARVAAIDEHERLRAQVDTYDAPGATLVYQEQNAIRAWKQTSEGKGTKTKSIRFRVGASSFNDLGVQQPTTWLSNSSVTISNVFTPRETLASLVSAAMEGYKDWTLIRPIEDRKRLLGQVFQRRKPWTEVFAVVGSAGEGKSACGKDLETWDEVLRKMLGLEEGEHKDAVAGTVEILVGLPPEPVTGTALEACPCEHH